MQNCQIVKCCYKGGETNASLMINGGIKWAMAKQIITSTNDTKLFQSKGITNLLKK
jgi:hypothetical protein